MNKVLRDGIEMSVTVYHGFVNWLDDALANFFKLVWRRRIPRIW